jgi:protein-disulfide isomerase
VSAAAVIGAALLIVLLTQQRSAPPTNDSVDLVMPSASYPTSPAEDESLGRADAPVQLEIWSDFQCPFCGQFGRTYLPRLVTDFIVPGTLRITEHDVDFRGQGDPDESVEAAVAARCAAAQNRYWPYHDLLFWNQHGENEGAFTDARLQAMADRAGLDRAAWDSCRSDPANAKEVQSTTQQAIAQGIQETPTLVVNGTPIVGLPRAYDDLASAIRAAAGTPSGTGSIAPSAP